MPTMDKAHKLTDKQLLTMEKKLTGIYSRALKELGKNWRSYLETVKEEIKDAQDAYDAAVAGGDKKAIDKAMKALKAKKQEKTIQDNRFKRMTDQLAHGLTEVNQKATAYVNGRLPSIYTANYNHTGQVIEDQVKRRFESGFAFDLVNEETVKRLAVSNKTLLPYKVIDGKKDVRWNTKKVNGEVLQGILQGETIPEISHRLERVVGMNLNSSIRNARTAVTGAENRGRQDSFERATEMGIVLERTWLSVHDQRVRDAHEELDGQTVGVDEPFVNSLGEIMYPGDPNADPANTYNCRCTIISRVVGFRRK